MWLNEKARAKVNLTLAVLGRRADGYHVLDSLVTFADIGDNLVLAPGETLSLEVAGPTAAGTGDVASNLVLKAANALVQLRPSLRTGHFRLTKHLPVAAGIGGGSSDAAAALRLLARANNLAFDDALVMEAARATGSDVPVCLEGATRWMRGAGEMLSSPLEIPALPAVLINPGVATPTAEVFRALAFTAGDVAPYDEALAGSVQTIADASSLIDILALGRNDLEPPSIALRPVIGAALALMRGQTGCRLAHMSGSGATVFGLFEDQAAATLARGRIAAAHPDWWAVETILGERKTCAASSP